jgi:hypothetical protein
MKETAWRSVLVGKLKKRDDLFCRVNEARAVRGYPDLTLIMASKHGEPAIAFYELKVRSSLPKLLETAFDPIQVLTLKKLRKIGCRAYGLVLLEWGKGRESSVAIYDAQLATYFMLPQKDFMERWVAQTAQDNPFAAEL